MSNGTFYPLLISCTAATLSYALSRLDYARKYETSAAVVRWVFRVDEARKQFEAANAACLAQIKVAS